jgi:hypothetical protein
LFDAGHGAASSCHIATLAPAIQRLQFVESRIFLPTALAHPMRPASLGVIPGDQAFRPLAEGGRPLVAQ